MNNADLSPRELADLKQRLQERFSALRQEIRAELLASDEERYIELAGQVHDLEDESVADLLVDVNLAVIDRHIKELQAIDAALLRLSADRFGICTDCGCPIGFQRLRVNPAVPRCLECQEKFEATHLRG